MQISGSHKKSNGTLKASLDSITGDKWQMEQMQVPQQDEGESCGYRMLSYLSKVAKWQVIQQGQAEDRNRLCYYLDIAQTLTDNQIKKQKRKRWKLLPIAPNATEEWLKKRKDLNPHFLAEMLCRLLYDPKEMQEKEAFKHPGFRSVYGNIFARASRLHVFIFRDIIIIFRRNYKEIILREFFPLALRARLFFAF